jgi:DNA-binding NarL/FixJ family response regulator
MKDAIESNLRVLIADDSNSLRNRLGRMISQIPGVGLLRLAADVPGALAALKDEPADLIVLDIQMPGGSGMDVLREVKKTSPATIVIMLTHHPYLQYQKRCLELGADYFLSKSTNSNDLLDLVERLARRRRIRDE